MQHYSNYERSIRSIPTLSANSCVDGYAERHAARMAESHKMYHQSLTKVMSGCGLRTAGENVAYGYSTGKQCVQLGWMKPAGHKANILSKNYRLIGVGAVKDSRGVWYVAQVFGTRR